MGNCFEFWHAVQEEMLFEDFFLIFFYLWMPFCLAGRADLGNFGRGHYKKICVNKFTFLATGFGDIVYRKSLTMQATC